MSVGPQVEHCMGKDTGDTITLGLSVGHYRADGTMLLDGTVTGTNPLLIPAPDTYLGFRWVRLEQINLPPGKQFAIMWEEEYRSTHLFSGEFPNTYPPETCKSRPSDPTDPNEWVYLVHGGLHEIPVEKPAGSAWSRDATVASSAGYVTRTGMTFCEAAPRPGERPPIGAYGGLRLIISPLPRDCGPSRMARACALPLLPEPRAGLGRDAGRATGGHGGMADR